MSLLVPNEGEVLFLSYALNKTSPADVKLHLFTNNHTPAEGDTTASYTESTAAGYSAKTLTGSSWSISTTSGTSTASYAAQTFTYTAAETVYGYYVTNNAANKVLWAELFPSAFAIPSGGGSVVVTPAITAE